MFTDYFINAFKTALACLAGFILANLLHLNSSMWVIITIMVVMTSTIHLGSALQKAYLRLLGTIIGACVAVLTVYFFHAENPYILYSIIILSAFFFSYLGGTSTAMGQAMTLGSVTVPIILLSPAPSLWTAYLRFSEITLGIFIALLVNFLIFPIHAKHHLEKILTKNMDILNNYYTAAYTKQSKTCALLEKTMMEYFTKATQLLDNAKHEPGAKEKLYKNILLHQKRLFRGISLLEYFSSPSLQAFIAQELSTLMDFCSLDEAKRNPGR